MITSASHLELVQSRLKLRAPVEKTEETKLVEIAGKPLFIESPDQSRTLQLRTFGPKVTLLWSYVYSGDNFVFSIGDKKVRLLSDESGVAPTFWEFQDGTCAISNLVEGKRYFASEVREIISSARELGLSLRFDTPSQMQ